LKLVLWKFTPGLLPRLRGGLHGLFKTPLVLTVSDFLKLPAGEN